MVASNDFNSAWAEISQQRAALKRLAQQSTVEILPLLQGARRLRVLGVRLGVHNLVGVASAIVAWSERANRGDEREQAGALLFELLDALERVHVSRLPTRVIGELAAEIVSG